jgi:putative ABC transport system permease protein
MTVEIGLFGYYLDLAFRSLRRNVALTALMVAVVGFGIGASMTMLTTLRALALDPIPGKSSQLFVPLINAGRPMPDTLTYSDAMALMKAHQALRQTAMFGGSLVVNAAGEQPFPVGGRAAYADFFRMFAVPFRSGGPWSQADDDGATNVVVLSARLADRLFPHADAVGKTITLSAHDFRIVGVTQAWNPVPRFYDLGFGTGLDGPEDVFLPFSTAVIRQMERPGPLRCSVVRDLHKEEYATIACYWIQFWVELPTAAAARSYKAFLYNFAAQRQQVGHFNWPLRVDLPDLHSWLALQLAVPDTLRVSSVVAFGFLVVCLINAAGLMLARFSARAGELGVRRALGASRWEIGLQCLVETAVVGLPAGLVGLGLTAAGLASQRALHMIAGSAEAVTQVTSLDGDMMVVTLELAVCATVCSALYAVWRASRVQPAWQLKTQ